MKKKNLKIKIILIFFILIFLIVNFINLKIYYNENTKRLTRSENIYLQTEDMEGIDDILDTTLNETTYDNIVENTQTQETSINLNEEDENINTQPTKYNIDSIEPHIDEATGIRYITYEDFGTSSDESFDNYQCMKNAHNYANENGYEVRATLSTYHIYKLDDTEPISIETNTNWNNANFIIHDENISELATRNYSIFQITSKEQDIVIMNNEVLNDISISKETKKIEQLAGNGNCLCIVYNNNKRQYIRSGSNANDGNPQTDLFKIDNDGNVLNEIQWNFDEITKITLKPIPDE